MSDHNCPPEEQRLAETDFIEVPKFRLASLLAAAPFFFYLIIVLFVGGVAPFLEFAALMAGIVALICFGEYWTRCYRIEWDGQRIILKNRRKKIKEFGWVEITRVKKCLKAWFLHWTGRIDFYLYGRQTEHQYPSIWQNNGSFLTRCGSTCRRKNFTPRFFLRKPGGSGCGLYPA